MALPVTIISCLFLLFVSTTLSDLAHRQFLGAARQLQTVQAQAAADGAIAYGFFQATTAGREAMPAGPQALAIGDVQTTLLAVDEGGKIDVNAAPPRLLEALLTAAGLHSPRTSAEAIVTARAQQLIQWPEEAVALVEAEPETKARLLQAITTQTGAPFLDPDRAYGLAAKAIRLLQSEAWQGDDPFTGRLAGVGFTLSARAETVSGITASRSARFAPSQTDMSGLRMVDWR